DCEESVRPVGTRHGDVDLHLRDDRPGVRVERGHQRVRLTSHDGEPPHHIESVSPQGDVVNPSVEAGGAEGSDSLTGVDVDLDYPADVLAVPLAEAAIDPSRLPVTGGKDPKHLAVHVGIEPSQDLVVALLKGNDVLTG